MAILLVLSLCIPAFANSPQVDVRVQNSELQQAEMQAFYDFIHCFFDSPGSWRAIGFDGEDISEEFYAAGVQLYESGALKELQVLTNTSVAFLDQVNMNALCNPERYPITPFASTLSRTTSTTLAYISNLTGAADFEFAIEMTGEYEYNPSTGKLTNPQNPTIAATFWQYPHFGTLSLTNIKRSAVIGSNGSRAEFTVTFAVYRHTDGWEPLYCGTFYGKIVGDTSGGEPVEYIPEQYGYPTDS